jgi:UTP--glucose-1-phosphate uridylyltransferase
MSVRKGVILAAGYGTRFLPATKALPKEMLPIVDRPVIQYIVEEAVAAGLQQLIIITSASKRALEDHFDRNSDLEQALAQRGDEARLQEICRLSDLAEIAFVRQQQPLGTGHAVLQARWLMGDEPFALFFPDDVIVSETPAIGQLIEVHERHRKSVLAVLEVPKAEVYHYGVIDPEPLEESVFRVRGMVEKPSPQSAPSNLISVGRFVLTPDIFPILEQTAAGQAGEVWLTDAISTLIERDEVYACQYEGERFDTGQPIGLLKASLTLALQREGLAPELRSYLQQLLASPTETKR